MPYPLNNATTAAGYTDGATFDTPPVEQASVIVVNSTVAYTLTTVREGVTISPYTERFLLPGTWVMREGLDWRRGEKLVKIQFRSWSSSPAYVTAN